MRKYPDLFLMIIIMGTMLMCCFSGIHKNASNPDAQKNVNVRVPDSLFHSGDLVFRDGRGFISNAFRRLSLKDPKYSHVGIIHMENGKLFVYHLIGGEENKGSKMRKDNLHDFCGSLQANAFAIYRTDLNGGKIDSLAGTYYRKGLLFDSKFDLNTDDKMYCTEFVYKILKAISKQDNFLPLTTLPGVKYSACDNIYLSPHTKKIFSYDYYL